MNNSIIVSNPIYLAHENILLPNLYYNRFASSLQQVRICLIPHMIFQFVPMSVNNNGERYTVPLVDRHELGQFL